MCILHLTSSNLSSCKFQKYKMIISVDTLKVYFPYKYIYPEQYRYMIELKRALDARGHCVIEMPSGTGKTITLLSLIFAYQKAFPSHLNRLVYCSRTIPELCKVMDELRKLLSYYEEETKQSADVLAIALSSRKNLCVNHSVVGLQDGALINAKCYELTHEIRGNKSKTAKKDPSVESVDIEDIPSLQCSFYERFKEASEVESTATSCTSLTTGVHSMDDLKRWSDESGQCPYFSARQALVRANFIVYSYAYLLDPRVAEVVSRDLGPKAVVVFDEAHNIDNVCIDALSIRLKKPVIDKALQCVRQLTVIVDEMKRDKQEELNDEYQKMVDNLKEVRRRRLGEEILANPTLPDVVLEEAVPGNIRKAHHFLFLLKRLVEFLRTRMRRDMVVIESPPLFLQDVMKQCCTDRRTLRFTHERLTSMLQNLRIGDIEQIAALIRTASFFTLASTYIRGFTVLYEPRSDSKQPNVHSPSFHLACLDASIAIKPVFRRFQTVVITSGTLSPLEMYPRILDFRVTSSACLTMSLARQCVCPMIVTRGGDQSAISSKFESREDTSVLRNYGLLLQDICGVTPDGVVAFFPSYQYLETAVVAWYGQGLVQHLQKKKLIFIETADSHETNIALAGYRRAVEAGRGALLFSVARGKVSEGVDFDHEYGRCVIMFGIPYVYTQSRSLRARLDFLRQMYAIREADFLTFDAMRHAAQCLGRAMRGKSDYGVMILADYRYNRADKRTKLPAWLQQQMSPAVLDLATDEAVLFTKRFFKLMGQSISFADQRRIALLDEHQIKKITNPQSIGV